jgi:hypothetical protein
MRLSRCFFTAPLPCGICFSFISFIFYFILFYFFCFRETTAYGRDALFNIYKEIVEIIPSAAEATKSLFDFSSKGKKKWKKLR